MMKIGKKMINKLENKILLNKIYLSNIYFLLGGLFLILIIFMKNIKIIKFRKYILLKL